MTFSKALENIINGEEYLQRSNFETEFSAANQNSEEQILNI